MAEALAVFALPLAVTVFIETGVAALLGLRRGALGAVVAVNLVTNPLLNLILLGLRGVGVQALWYWVIVGLLEVLVVFAEWLILVRVLGPASVSSRRLLLTSVIMNVMSATVGTAFVWAVS